MSFSCQNCRKSRRKCDRGKPTCSRCVKYKIDCVYELPPKHKIKHSSNGAAKAKGSNNDTIFNFPGGELRTQDNRSFVNAEKNFYEQTTSSCQFPVLSQLNPPSLNSFHPYHYVQNGQAQIITNIPAPAFVQQQLQAKQPTDSPSQTGKGHAIEENASSLTSSEKLPGKNFLSLSFAEEDTRSKFETTADLVSHIVKDPFYHYFLMSQILTGTKLIKLDPSNSSLWFSCVIEAGYVLSEGENRGSKEDQNDFNPIPLTELVKQILSALPSVEHLNTYKSFYYKNVHTMYPLFDAQRFETQFQSLLLQNNFFADANSTLLFFSRLIVSMRLAHLSVVSYYSVFDPTNSTFRWALENKIPHDLVRYATLCIRPLLESPTPEVVKVLISLRLLILLDDEVDESLVGWSDKEMCELINRVGIRLKTHDPNMWLTTCWNNLHYMMLCGAADDQINGSVFEDEETIINDIGTLEEIIALDDNGKVDLELKYFLKKGYALFKLIVNNRFLEKRVSEEEFLQMKIQENNSLRLLLRTHSPLYEYTVGPGKEVELVAGVKVNLSVFNDFNKFKWESFIRIKQLSNYSLLMFHFEKQESPLFWTHLLFTLESTIDVASNFKKNLQNLEIFKTPSRIVAAHIVCIIANRTIVVISGLITRFFYFRLNCRDPELISLIREILLKLFEILQDIVTSCKMNASQPKTASMALNMIQLFNLGKLEFSITCYLNSSHEELQHYQVRAQEDSRWIEHLKLSPPSNLVRYGKIIMNMNKIRAKDVLKILTLYDE